MFGSDHESFENDIGMKGKSCNRYVRIDKRSLKLD